MAIINSLAIGKSYKSAGNLTYKTIRGRTIASQRITSNKSNTAAQQEQRSHFSAVSSSMKLIQQYINICYEKSKYGSSRNMFFKVNKNFNFGGLYGELAEGLVTLSDAMLSALTNVPVHQLSALSWGSLPGFLTIHYKDVPNYKYGGHTYNTLRVIIDDGADTYASASYLFQFASPVKYTDLKIYVFGFSDSGLLVDVGTIAEKGAAAFDFSGGSLQTVVSPSVPHYNAIDNNLVDSVTVGASMASAEGCPILIAVPVVGNRVPTIAGVFAKTSAV